MQRAITAGGKRVTPAKLQAERRHVPGPGSYEIAQPICRGTKSFSVRNKLPNEKELECRDAREGPGPAAFKISCYNDNLATKFVSRNEDAKATKSCKVKKAWSFGKDGRRVNEEAMKHGRQVPSPDRYNPIDTLVKEKSTYYSLGQRLKDIFMPQYKHGAHQACTRGHRRASLDEKQISYYVHNVSHHRTAS